MMFSEEQEQRKTPTKDINITQTEVLRLQIETSQSSAFESNIASNIDLPKPSSTTKTVLRASKFNSRSSLLSSRPSSAKSVMPLKSNLFTGSQLSSLATIGSSKIGLTTQISQSSKNSLKFGNKLLQNEKPISKSRFNLSSLSIQAKVSSSGLAMEPSKLSATENGKNRNMFTLSSKMSNLKIKSAQLKCTSGVSLSPQLSIQSHSKTTTQSKLQSTIKSHSKLRTRLPQQSLSQPNQSSALSIKTLSSPKSTQLSSSQSGSVAASSCMVSNLKGFRVNLSDVDSTLKKSIVSSPGTRLRRSNATFSGVKSTLKESNNASKGIVLKNGSAAFYFSWKSTPLSRSTSFSALESILSLNTSLQLKTPTSLT